MSDEEKEKTQKENEALIREALKAYGIDPKFAFSVAVKPGGEVGIVTRGGKKVRWAKGMKDIPELSAIEITGINPEAEKRKPIMGKKK